MLLCDVPRKYLFSVLEFFDVKSRYIPASISGGLI
jgi:hypothetical protein